MREKIEIKKKFHKDEKKKIKKWREKESMYLPEKT